MELKAVQCPNCGSELQLPDNKSKVVCVYCDTSILVGEVIEKKAQSMGSDNIELWLALAQAAREGNNFEKSIEYYDKILEVDHKHSESWFWKGSSLSTIIPIDKKLKVIMPYFQNAIKYSDSKQGMRQQVAIALYIASLSVWMNTQTGTVDVINCTRDCLDALKIAVEYQDQDKDDLQDPQDPLVRFALSQQEQYVELALSIRRDAWWGVYSHHDPTDAKNKEEYFYSKMRELNPALLEEHLVEVDPTRKRTSEKSGCVISLAFLIGVFICAKLL